MIASCHADRLIVADVQVDALLRGIFVIVLDVVIHPEQFHDLAGRLEAIGEGIAIKPLGKSTQRFFYGHRRDPRGALQHVPGEREQCQNDDDARLADHGRRRTPLAEIGGDSLLPVEDIHFHRQGHNDAMLVVAVVLLLRILHEIIIGHPHGKPAGERIAEARANAEAFPVESVGFIG